MRIRPILVVLAVPLILGSCGPQRNEFAPACPVPGKLRQLSELTRYRGQSRDFRDLIIRAQVVDIQGTCEAGDGTRTVVAKAVIVVDATRGPAMQGDGMQLPMFIAVTDSGSVLDKTLFWLPVTFANNVDTTRVVTKEVRMEIPVTPQKSAAAYGVIGGFQLTPEEVAVWRRDNPR